MDKHYKYFNKKIKKKINQFFEKFFFNKKNKFIEFNNFKIISYKLIEIFIFSF
jgi:hypothetical protein